MRSPPEICDQDQGVKRWETKGATSCDVKCKSKEWINSLRPLLRMPFAAISKM